MKKEIEYTGILRVLYDLAIFIRPHHFQYKNAQKDSTAISDSKISSDKHYRAILTLIFIVSSLNEIKIVLKVQPTSYCYKKAIFHACRPLSASSSFFIIIAHLLANLKFYMELRLDCDSNVKITIKIKYEILICRLFDRLKVDWCHRWESKLAV